MSIFIGFMTVILVLNCLFLILLILIQLPKKEAGAGVAFGGGATEALFGAGSGTVLTKVTKYAAGIFMGMALLLSVLNAHHARNSARALEIELERTAAESSQSAPVVPQPAAAPEVGAPMLQSTATNIAPTAPAPANPDAPAGQP
ncbi:MAG: preprotein translocase subunit SecG [Verrucomicrobia bacterium]|nr:preprotein translocase subunit SecG [Verrucomicrobiota bacterium]